ncbi:hypothetical protein ABZV34_39235 [Streptomyces sp. NPDC005195]
MSHPRGVTGGRGVAATGLVPAAAGAPLFPAARGTSADVSFVPPC